MIDAPPPPAPEPRRRARGWLLEIVETIILTIAIFLGIQTFVARPFQVQMVSMQTTLQAGQYVLIDELTPRWSAFQRGDIVVFDPPPAFSGRGGTPLIKRVIGLPGERIELVDGVVRVDGKALEEPYLFAEDGTPQPTEPISGTSSWVVAPGEVFVMGDHREESQDSRLFGPIRTSSVLGRAVLRYWPIDAFEVIQRPSYR